MRVLIAPDKFKGTLSAAQAAAAIAEGALRIYPEAVTTVLPMADGGEGTVEAAVAAGFEERLNAVVGPILRPTGAVWAVNGVSAVIETAQASGYLLAEPSPENALRAHSYGCGQLIAAALDAGASEIVLGLGGSAMTDGGTGALRALGLKLLDQHGAFVPLGGGSLAEVVAIDASGLDQRLATVKFRIAVDVDNPLYGPLGAAQVFAPQKGADADGVELLDAGLRNLASLLRESFGVDVDVPGAGAAGGFPASFLALAGSGLAEVTIESGVELVAELLGLREKIAEADLVITGEGSVDEQSLAGKTPIGVARAAQALGVPVVLVAGQLSVGLDVLGELGVVAAASAAESARSEELAMSEPERYLRQATENALNGI
ncbi:glycerate kinase [Psychromicrobium lacuslunae]|uniref:Glycerate kinase n=1 Tax=Psychromicrobium lacuslunae TaxID=1618207 RepID=A0A0D4C0W6_9MICC|nr:glycerate kinase [Psychromicrobium lacuslunae]AJT42332.1 glycerate kinase [Psychromicrobium lacuslunae]